MHYKFYQCVCLLTAGISFVFSQSETGFFWQLTDLHYDPWYHTTQESCNENLTVLGKYGDFECDSPWELVRSSIQAMVDIPRGREADFILWSGDNPPHAKNHNALNKNVILEIHQNITDVIQEVFPDKLVIPVIGNHDFYPTNQLPGSGSDIYDAYAEMWSDWLNGTDVKTTFKKGAYFTLILSEAAQVRAVVLNTNLYLESNDATEGEADPGEQFAWFEEVMMNARNQGEKVHVFTHVPPGKVPEADGGTGWFRPQQNAQLVTALASHSDIILGIYSAHSHLDSYKIFYGTNGNPASSMFIAPSVSPWRTRLGDGVKGSAHNPGLRRYTFQQSTYQLKDIEQYSLDLEQANEKLEANWMYLYSFASTYKLEDISTPQLQYLLDDMKQYASENFHRYYDFNTVDTHHSSNVPCGCICKTAHLCSIEFAEYDLFDECFQEQAACSADKIYPTFVSLLLFLTWAIRKI